MKGVPVDIEQALTAAARLLKHAGKPLIAGLGTDVNGIRAALQLAEETGAALLHTEERHAVHNLKVLQTRGWIMTTLAEVKNRADTIIFVGNDVTANYPRFIERFINTPHSLFAGKNRNLAYLGRPGEKELEQCSNHAPVVISGHDEEIADDLALLRAKIAGNPLLDCNNVPAIKNRKLDDAAAMIKAAEYGVFVWSPAALPEDHADIIIASLTELIRGLNLRQRFAGLSLSGSNGGASFQNIATWQTGFPANVSYRDGSPSGDDTVNGYPPDVDNLLWISTFADRPPPKLNVPTVVLSPYPALAADADVYIPVGVPGIDHAGNLFRTDSIINLPLKKVRDSGSHSTAEILARISVRMKESRRD